MAIITVTNEYGSAGYELAARVAELTGYDFIDRQVISVLSKVSGMPEEIVEHCDETLGGPHRVFTEKVTTRHPELRDLSKMIDLEHYYQDVLSKKRVQKRMEGVAVSLDTNPLLRCVLQSSEKARVIDKKECLPERYTHCLENVLIQIARKDNCIFIGRYARGILREFTNAFHVRVFAPMEARMQRTVDLLSISRVEAGELIKNIDAKRKKFFEDNYSLDITDHSIYDLVINTGTFEIDIAARMVASIV
jgi:hypothetical protein